MVAIIPAAGKGTRMQSVTGGGPKELLPLGRRSVLERILMEARDAGLDSAVIVNSPEKPQIDEAVEHWSQASLSGFPIRIAYQSDPKGLAYAVAEAGVEDDAIIMVGDVVYTGGSPIERMSNLIYRGINGCIAVEPVEEPVLHLYGVVEVDDMTGSITRIIEKPQPSETQSRWAVASRWAFSKLAMLRLADACGEPDRAPNSRELTLTDIITAQMGDGLEFKAVALQPGQARVDCGSAAEYAIAKRMPWD